MTSNSAIGALLSLALLVRVVQHYFRTALELRSLIPDRSRGNGFWLVTVNRSRPDGLDGAGSAIIRRRVRGKVKDAAEAGLLRAKQRFETQ